MCLLLSELLRTSHQILSIPEIPITHEQSFIRIALSSPGLTRVTPPFGNTSHSERITTSMLDLRKKTNKKDLDPTK